MALRPLDPAAAIELNRKITFSDAPNPPAKPFALKGGADVYERALTCLTAAIYYEAASEPEEGQRAVAQVVLNRVRHPAYPPSICGVVYQGSTLPTGCQFTFTCDGSMAHRPMASAWSRARKAAWAALNGAVYAPAGLSTHYHANYVLPYWASSLVKLHVEGPHIFYRWAGNWGRPSAFRQSYAAREADSAVLRQAALAVEHVLPKALIPDTEMATIEALDQIEGVKVEENGKRVSIAFNPKAREAVEKAVVTPYVERVAASDNLRRALDGGGAQGAEAKPFGTPAEALDKPATPAK
jgi:hypothetical protein